VAPSATKAQKLDGIQVGRAGAALLVVCYHAGRMLSLPQYLGHITALGKMFAFGNAGVDFFFALSGFIIYFVHQADIGKPSRLGHYVWRRVTRIYPMYWVATVIVITFAILKHDWQILNANHIVKSFFLSPSLEDPLLGVGWTLTHEMFFYTVFAFAIASRAVGAALAFCWVLLVLVGFYHTSDVAFLRFAQSPYHLQFALGIFSAVALGKSKSQYAWIAFASGLLLFIGASLLIDLHRLSNDQITSRCVFGIGSALILYGIAAMEKRGILRVPGWAAFFGGASYSIYLFHTIIIGLFAKALFQIVSVSLPSAGVFVGTVFVAVLVGCAAYQTIEVPLQSLVRSWGKSSKLRVAPTA
jgi:exopolysaccharide production protein ExoZ